MDLDRDESVAGELAVPDERTGQYARIEEIGRGGQSAVWLALDGFLGREVAVKEVLPQTLDGRQDTPSSAALQRFLREARVTARLDHPSIVPIYELAKRSNGALFCAQKLIRGETLKLRLATCKSLDDRLALLPHLIDACQAVAYAHSRGVVHRDLKPSNIMVGAFGETVVVDWGLAKQRGLADDFPAAVLPAEPALSMAGKALGTPAYMSPEQVRGAVDEIDERSDVFGLGVILYELLAAKLPFEGDDSTKVMQEVLRGEFEPVRKVCPEAPAELAAVAERAMQRDPKDRYPGAEPLAKELVAYRAGGRVVAYEYRSWELVQKFFARNRAASLLGVALLLFLACASAGIAWQLHGARISLSRSLLERGREAAKSSDWARAAGYYAASRVQADSREGQWGSALAAERMPKRILARVGPPGSYVAVGILADGTAITLATENGVVIARELESGRELWRTERQELARGRMRVTADGHVRFTTKAGVRILDGRTGALRVQVTDDRSPCGSTATSPAIAFGDSELTNLVVFAGQETHTLIRDLNNGSAACALSRDGRRVAVHDREGNVRVWDLPSEKELLVYPAPDASDLLFTAHGLAVVRERSVELLAEDGGRTVIATGVRPRNGNNVSRANAVSPDGHLLIVPDEESNNADLIDLSQRKMIATVTYAPGRPRFAFSADGERLYAAGLGGEAALLGWDVRQPPPPVSFPGGSPLSIEVARDGDRFALMQQGRHEVRDSSGRLLRLVEFSKDDTENAAISPDGTKLLSATGSGLSVVDVETGATVFAPPDCKRCLTFSMSRDGKRLITDDEEQLTVWDVEQQRPLWRTRDHVAGFLETVEMAPDGRHVAWNHLDTVHLHGDEGDRALRFDVQVEYVEFDDPGRRLAVATSVSIEVYDVESLRLLLRVPNQSWVHQSVFWSSDGSVLIQKRDGRGPVLIDSSTGETLAAFDLRHAPGNMDDSRLARNLRFGVSTGDGRWNVDPLPAPDSSPPGESLARILREAGLELRGVELLSAR